MKFIWKSISRKVFFGFGLENNLLRYYYQKIKMQHALERKRRKCLFMSITVTPVRKILNTWFSGATSPFVPLAMAIMFIN